MRHFTTTMNQSALDLFHIQVTFLSSQQSTTLSVKCLSRQKHTRNDLTREYKYVLPTLQYLMTSPEAHQDKDMSKGKFLQSTDVKATLPY